MTNKYEVDEGPVSSRTRQTLSIPGRVRNEVNFPVVSIGKFFRHTLEKTLLLA
jgi:hypothetical protein